MRTHALGTCRQQESYTTTATRTRSRPPSRAGNRQDARTIMADPGDCATTTAVALTPPAGSHEEAALLTPEKEKPPRLVGPRIKPVGDRIRTAEEVG